MAKSEVHGWGLFTKQALKRGDFVHEYLGEIITHDEAERRGEIYDKQNQTYLFDLSTDYAVDALRKGNKTRFINHSQNPNLITRLCIVNGDVRIGFFAKVDIPAQSELFFDYGLNFFAEKSDFAEKGNTKPEEKSFDKER
jgi:histone-lysine N-methyltransferase EZH2